MKLLIKLIYILIIISGFVFTSCEIESRPSGEHNENIIDTTIISGETFAYNFGYFGDEEGISIISYPKNAKTCVLLNKPWEERILTYVPNDRFHGIDTVIVETRKGSDGVSPATDIETTTLVIKVVIPIEVLQ
jgi:hypothetical protein